MDRYTKGFVLASLVYFFLAAGFGMWMGMADTPEWDAWRTMETPVWNSQIRPHMVHESGSPGIYQRIDAACSGEIERRERLETIVVASSVATLVARFGHVSFLSALASAQTWAMDAISSGSVTGREQCVPRHR